MLAGKTTLVHVKFHSVAKQNLDEYHFCFHKLSLEILQDSSQSLKQKMFARTRNEIPI